MHNSTAAKSPWSKASLRGTRSKADESSVTAKLWGVTRFGENIEDEWLIVWLLYQITLKVAADKCSAAWPFAEALEERLHRLQNK